MTEATLWTIEGNDEEARMAIVGGVVAGAVVGILSKIAKAYKAWRAGKNSKIIHSKPSGNDPPEVETIEDLFDRAVLPTNQGGAGLSNAQLNKLQGDFDGKPELITFMFRPGAVKAWKVLDEAGTALKTNVIALGKVDFLKSKGFSDVNLKILGEADDIKVLNFAEGFALRNLDEVTTMSRHSKMMEIKGLAGSGEFSKYQDDINSLMTAKNGNGDFLLQNPDGLSSKVSAMNTSGSGNPFQLGGHDFEIEWALDIANQGKSVRLDASNLPDVLDDVGKHAYELKKLNGTGANSLGTNSKTAVNQIKPTGTGPAPSDYTKNVVIKVNNSDHPHMNATKQDLIEYLQGYNQNSGTPQFPGPSGTLNGIDKFIIKNNTGLHEILGSVIDI